MKNKSCYHFVIPWTEHTRKSDTCVPFYMRTHWSATTLKPAIFVYFPLVQPKQLEAWTPQDPWMCPLVSGTKMSAAYPLSFKVGPSWFRLVFPAHPSDPGSDWDPGNLEAKTTPLWQLVVMFFKFQLLFCQPYRLIHSWLIIAMMAIIPTSRLVVNGPLAFVRNVYMKVTLCPKSHSVSRLFCVLEAFRDSTECMFWERPSSRSSWW